MLRKNEFRKGVASFYIVAISTLVLVIISASFAAVIISELARTSNNDLAQSAYDSAMAGVEDAKLAYYNYIKCRESGESAGSLDVGDGVVKCSEIMQYIENEQDCYTVAHVLGRISQNESGEVLIKETSEGDNKMKQAYTCVKIKGVKGNESSEYIDNFKETSKAIKVSLAEGEEAKNIKAIKIKWMAGEENDEPPIIGFGIIQTAEEFTLDEFDMTRGNQTNRGTVFLVPYIKENEYKELDSNKVNKVYNESSGVNVIGSSGFLNSNDKIPENKPYAVYCGDMSGGKNCEVTIELPDPVGGGRNNDTFMITRSVIGGVGEGQTLEYSFCKESECSFAMEDNVEGGKSSAVPLNMQVVVDSTGRANDLFRRVEAVLEDTSAVSGMSLGLYNAVQADNIYKIESALCEAKFINPSNCAQ